MSQVIRIPKSTYKRLEARVEGFDTPANVIERLIDYYEKSENFVSTKSDCGEVPQRNTSKYTFENHIFGKGRLILAVVKSYVSNNLDTSFDKLQQFCLATVLVMVCFFAFNSNVNAGTLTKIDPVAEATPFAKNFFPTANSLNPFEGEPASAAVYDENRLLGYVFFTDHILPIPGYSRKPIHTLVGFDLTGKIVGVEIVSHKEPILLAGVSEQDLTDFKNQYLGQYAGNRVQLGGSDREGYITLDSISGATITSMVLNTTIMTSLQEVAKSRGIVRTETSSDLTEEEPIWVYTWRDKTFQIAVLSAGLLLLLLILIF